MDVKKLWTKIWAFLKTKVSSKVIIWSLIGTLVVVGAWTLWESWVYDRHYREWASERAVAVEIIKQLAEQRNAAVYAANIFAQEAENYRTQRDGLQEELNAAQVKIEEEILSVTDLPLTEIAVATAQLLEVAAAEVRVTEFGLELSQEAARRNLQMLIFADWHLGYERPRIEFTLALYKKENAALYSEITLLKKGLALAQEEITVYAEQAVKDAEMVARAQRRIKVQTVKAVLVTGAAVVGTYLLVDKILIPLFRR